MPTHTLAGSKMKSSDGVRFADAAYTEWPAVSTSALQQSLRHVSFLISAPDQELSHTGEDSQLGVYWWAAGQHCPSDQETQE